jgi:hypothetical protein
MSVIPSATATMRNRSNSLRIALPNVGEGSIAQERVYDLAGDPTSVARVGLPQMQLLQRHSRALAHGRRVLSEAAALLGP